MYKEYKVATSKMYRKKGKPIVEWSHGSPTPVELADGQHEYHSMTETAFEEYINRFIKEGWQPIGGVCAHHRPDGCLIFYQTMVR